MNAWAWEAIPAILAMEDYGDDYMKFWFAFTLEKISRGRYIDRKLTYAALKETRRLWIEILEHPAGIIEDHKKEIGNTGRLTFQSTSPKDYILKHTKSRLTNVNWSRDLDPEDIVDLDALSKT